MASVCKPGNKESEACNQLLIAKSQKKPRKGRNALCSGYGSRLWCKCAANATIKQGFEAKPTTAQPWQKACYNECTLKPFNDIFVGIRKQTFWKGVCKIGKDDRKARYSRSDKEGYNDLYNLAHY
jgi:hypothetical protein